MKINYNLKYSVPKFIKLFTVFLVFYSASGQVLNKGNLFVGDNATFYVKGSFRFGSTGLVRTSTASNTTYGKVSLSPFANVNGISGTQFFKGYLRKRVSSEYLFPIGIASRYAPVQITPDHEFNVDAAYFASNPNEVIGSAIDVSSVSYISTAEYWIIKGFELDPNNDIPSLNAKISLSWRTTTSKIQTIANGVFDDLTIVGYNVTNNSWEQIPSLIDVTSILSETSSIVGGGSITSFYDVDLSQFSAYTIGRKGLCSILFNASGATKTWNGSWEDGVPNLSDRVVINAPFSGSISCNSLVLNANLTLANGQLAEIINGVQGSGKIIMASEASVVQRSNSQLKPIIELNKQSRAMRAFDYIYWGSPIVEDSFSQLANAQAQSQSGTSLIGALDSKYYYQSGTGGGWRNLTTTVPGKGFITRVKNQAPFDTFTSLQSDYINLKFSGEANNGDITVNVSRNPTNVNGGTSHNLLANPYPCAIDIDKFLVSNPNLDGVIYIWRAVTQNSPAGTAAYGQADYIPYTRAGFAAAAWATRETFLGKVASGQGFLVKYLGNQTATPDSGTVTFTNCMKMTAYNSDFNRINNDAVVKNRYKLNMTGSNNVYSQILIAYLPECSYDYDRLYDAPRNSVSTAKLYSILENGGTKLAINARPDFVSTDVVPLGLSKSTATVEDFSINVSDLEGIFDTEGVTIILHDILLDVYHSFVNGAYTFTADALTTDNRFELVYQAPIILNNQNFNVGQIITNITSNVITITSSNKIKSIEIFDISGRNIQTYELNGANSTSKPFVFSEGIYVAKIKLENGAIVSKKIINNNK